MSSTSFCVHLLKWTLSLELILRASSFVSIRSATHYKSLPARTKAQWDQRVLALILSPILVSMSIHCIFLQSKIADRFNWTDRTLSKYQNAHAVSEIVGAASLHELMYYFRWGGWMHLLHSISGIVLAGGCELIVGHYYSPRVALYEASTFFLHMDWFLSVFGQQSSRFYTWNGLLLLAVFFSTRLVYGSWLLAFNFLDANDLARADPDVFDKFSTTNKNSLWMAALGLAGMHSVLNLLNVYWFIKLIKKVRVRFGSQSRSAFGNDGEGHSIDHPSKVRILPSRNAPKTLALCSLSGSDIGTFLSKAVEPLRKYYNTVGSVPQYSNTNLQQLRTTDEKVLQAVWADVLHIELSAISRGDNFFDLGGDSLTVLELVLKAKEKSLFFTMLDVFHAPSLAALAVTARQNPLPTDTPSESKANTELDELPPFSLLNNRDDVESIKTLAASECRVEKGAIADVYPCTVVQQQLMRLTVEHPNTKAQGTQVVFYLDSKINVEIFKKSVRMVYNSTPILRTRFIQQESTLRPQFLQVVLQEEVQFVCGTNLTEYIETDRVEPFKIGMPLARFAIFNTEDFKSVFVATISHCIYDARSVKLLFQMIETSYQSGGGSLPPTVPFRNFIRAELTADKSLTGSFWTSYLAGHRATRFLPKPTWICRTGETVTIKASMSFGGLRRPGITSATLCYAAWALVMANISKSDDIMFQVTLGGRDVQLSGIDMVIGPTLIHIPFRVRVPRAASREASILTSDYLESVQRQRTALTGHGHMKPEEIAQLSSGAGVLTPECRLHVRYPYLAVQNLGVKKFTSGMTMRRVPALGRDVPLQVQCEVAKDRIEVEMVVDTAFVDEFWARQRLGNLEHAVKVLAADEGHGVVQDVF